MATYPEPSLDQLLERNRNYAEHEHKPSPKLLDMMRGDFKLNGPHTLVISCLDSRCNPILILQAKPFELFVFRNVGGRVKSLLTDLLALDSQFGINKIILMQHSDCGSGYIKPGQVSAHVKNTTEDAANAEIWENEIMTHSHTTSKQSLAEDLALLKQQPFIRKVLKETAVGLWLDVETGLLSQMEAAVPVQSST